MSSALPLPHRPNLKRYKEVRRRCYEAIALLVRLVAKLDPEHWRDHLKKLLILERINSDAHMQAARRDAAGAWTPFSVPFGLK